MKIMSLSGLNVSNSLHTIWFILVYIFQLYQECLAYDILLSLEMSNHVTSIEICTYLCWASEDSFVLYSFDCVTIKHPNPLTLTCIF